MHNFGSHSGRLDFVDRQAVAALYRHPAYNIPPALIRRSYRHNCRPAGMPPVRLAPVFDPNVFEPFD